MIPVRLLGFSRVGMGPIAGRRVAVMMWLVQSLTVMSMAMAFKMGIALKPLDRLVNGEGHPVVIGTTVVDHPILDEHKNGDYH